MEKKDNLNKGTDPDVRPTRGQETNENWDESNDDRTSSDTTAGSSTDARTIDEQTNTSGAGSSQRTRADNVGPLQSDLEQLPSQKRADRGNATGSGIG